MKILNKNSDLNLLLDANNDNQNDLGWQEDFNEFEKETLDKIINKVENYETIRFQHDEYDNQLISGITQNDIWFIFNFLNNNNNYVIDYAPTNIKNIFKNESFFRLEFFKTESNELPNVINRRLVFSKNIPINVSTKYVNTNLKLRTYKPVFIGSNIKNKEIFYLFWFIDDSSLKENILKGDTFYFTAKFYNTTDGLINDFVNKDTNNNIIEENDIYYKLVINRNNYRYTCFDMNDNRVGTTNNPLIFYQKKN